MDRKTRVGVVGLGAMGFGMAATLAKAGFAVTGYDLEAGKAKAAAEAGFDFVSEPGTLFATSERIVFSLPTAQDVAAMLEAHAAIVGTQAEGRVILIDTSTSEPDVSRALARRLADAGHGFLDAPVSGGPAGAASGKLTMMIGGDEADLAEARTVVEALAAKILHVGPSGAGNVAKLVNNLLVAAHMLTTQEALKLAVGAGVDAESVLRVLNAATGRSAISEIHFPNWVMSGRFDSGFSMGLMRKDVRLAGAMADEFGVDLPLCGHVRDIWAASTERLADGQDFTRMGDYADDDERARNNG